MEDLEEELKREVQTHEEEVRTHKEPHLVTLDLDNLLHKKLKAFHEKLKAMVGTKVESREPSKYFFKL